MEVATGAAKRQDVEPPHLQGLAQRLVAEEILTEAEARHAVSAARRKEKTLLAYLFEANDIDTGAVCRTAADIFGVPIIDLAAINWDEAPVRLVSESLIRTHQALPIFRRGSRLFVAVCDPSDAQAMNALKFHTGLGVESVLVDNKQLAKFIDHALDLNDTTLSDLVRAESLDDIDISSEVGDDRNTVITAEQIDAPIVRFVNKLILDAIRRGASDIHIEPYEMRTRVRYRVDGVLHEIASPPTSLASRIVARVKIMANLDIAERRVPQDGRMKLSVSRTKHIDFRVSTLPTLYGEKAVIRILDTNAAEFGVDALGFEPGQLEHYLQAVKRPHGMILVTGPTGSGKTVTLYSALNILNTPERNISSVEDPVEINLAGVNQVNINEKANLTFSTALRSFLRQDPDVIMVGEIRDLETADIAVKASQTGHLVLSTVHTNNAPSTLSRLLNMGVPPFNIASAVHLIMAQRLIRKLCDTCKRPVRVPSPALLQAGFAESNLDGLQIFEAIGCEHCTGGYRGRMGIFEVMPISDEMSQLMMKGRTQLDLEHQALLEGMLNLRQSGLLKVRTGNTSLEEVTRVTSV